MTHNKHIIKQGEYLSKLAAECGLGNYSSIWCCSENTNLKAKRDNPNVLYPGDEIIIPEINTKQESVSTDQRHGFRVLGQVIKLRLQIKDTEIRPIANTECQLSIGFKTYQLKTDDEGKIETSISSKATRGELTIQDMVFPLLIGYLDPVDELSGWIARLNNLGYDAGNPDSHDEMQVRSAVEEFQCDYGLKVDGICGPNTKKKLEEVFGC